MWCGSAVTREQGGECENVLCGVASSVDALSSDREPGQQRPCPVGVGGGARSRGARVRSSVVGEGRRGDEPPAAPVASAEATARAFRPVRSRAPRPRGMTEERHRDGRPVLRRPRCPVRRPVGPEGDQWRRCSNTVMYGAAVCHAHRNWSACGCTANPCPCACHGGPLRPRATTAPKHHQAPHRPPLTVYTPPPTAA